MKNVIVAGLAALALVGCGAKEEAAVEAEARRAEEEAAKAAAEAAKESARAKLAALGLTADEIAALSK